METKPLTALQALRVRHTSYLRDKHPNTPVDSVAAGKTWKLTTTNGLTQAIISFITYSGGFANRINSTGRQIKTKANKSIYIPGTTKRGTPDVDAVFWGRAIKIEVKNKATGDRMSDDQHRVKNDLQRAGAIYFIAESFDAFYQWWITEIEE